MPQKRRTKAVRHSRSKPNMPAGDEKFNLNAQQKKKKLDLLLKDFDAEVQERVASMREFTAQAGKHIETAYMVELLQIPKHLREMKVTDFLAAGGDVSKVAMMDARKIVEVIANSVASKVTQASLKEGSGDKQTEDTATVQKKPRGGRKKNGTTMKTNTMPPPSTRTRRARQLATPACNQSASTKGWETPLVTPRFDPRLPMTPAMMRKPKPGERVITMSMAGSPLTNGPKTTSHNVAECSVPLSGDKMLVVTSDMDVDNMQVLDSDVMEKIEKLQSKLAKLIDYSKVNQAA
ncbi:Borealin [Lamellibrachia satsuma]|nr:Borealin [Lamellibrachia satsuma]